MVDNLTKKTTFKRKTSLVVLWKTQRRILILIKFSTKVKSCAKIKNPKELKKEQCVIILIWLNEPTSQKREKEAKHTVFAKEQKQQAVKKSYPAAGKKGAKSYLLNQ